MRNWLTAIHLIGASKKGSSSHQLHRVLGITLKSAWFMSPRIREPLKQQGVEPMGGVGKHVESSACEMSGRIDQATQERVASRLKHLRLKTAKGRRKPTAN